MPVLWALIYKFSAIWVYIPTHIFVEQDKMNLNLHGNEESKSNRDTEEKVSGRIGSNVY